jgi:Protein of unknown function (DUF2934)
VKYKAFFPNEKLAGARTPAPTTGPTQTVINAKPSHDEVAKRAYYLYLKQGCPQGKDVQHWLEAEAQMASR